MVSVVLYGSAYSRRQYGLFVGGEVDLQGLTAERISLDELPEEIGWARMSLKSRSESPYVSLDESMTNHTHVYGWGTRRSTC